MATLAELLKKREELARTTGKKVLEVLDEAAATTAGAKEDNVIVIDEAPVVFRQCVINNVEVLGETVSKKNGKTYIRVALIGRDLGSNATLRTWALLEKGQRVFAQGDLADFPCVHIPFGKFGYANDSFIQPIKPEGVYQHTSQKNAELWNEIRMEGFAKAVQMATSATAVAVGGRN